MRSRFVPVALVTLILVWLVLGGLALWEIIRNRPSPIPVVEIALPAIPEDNAYDDFVEATKWLMSPPELSWRKDAPVPAEGLRAVEEAAPALAAIREALTKPCVAPLRTSLEQEFPELIRFRWAVRLFVIESRHARASGRVTQCLDGLHDALRFAQAVEIGGEALHRLASLGMETISLHELGQAVNARSLTPEQLERVIRLLQERECTEPALEQAIEAEFRGLKASAAQLDRQFKARGRSSLPPMMYNLDAIIRRLEQDRSEALASAGPPYRELAEAGVRPDKKGLRFPSVTAGMADTLSDIFVTGCRGAARANTRTCSQRGGTQLLAAIELYRLRQGGLPESLQELHSMKIEGVEALRISDPLSDEPFIYRLSDGDYWLYSVSDNLTDDGGRPRQRGQSNGPDDIVLHKPATVEGGPNT